MRPRGIPQRLMPFVCMVETGESRTPRPENFPLEYATGLSSIYFSLPGPLLARVPWEPADASYVLPIGVKRVSTSI